jgi:hypothetical protein
LNITEAVNLPRVRRRCVHAPENCLYARKKFGHFEGLTDVVVRSEFQTHNFIDDFAARSEHDDRSVEASLSQIALHVKPISAWQHYIEDNQIEGLTGGPDETGFAVSRGLYDVTLA